MTYGGIPADHHAGLQRLRQRRYCLLAHHAAQLHDDGHQLQPGDGLALRLVVLGAVDANYSFTYGPGSVSVARAPLTITRPAPP